MYDVHENTFTDEDASEASCNDPDVLQPNCGKLSIFV